MSVYVPHLILAGCTSKKRSERSPARELYDPSPLFRGRRAYCERRAAELHVPWGILSGLHGVLAPEEELDPYNVRLPSHLDGVAFNTWAQSVRDGLARVFERFPGILESVPQHVVEIHAGRPYVEAFARAVPGWYVIHPVARLQIGEQLAYYKRAIGSE